MAQAPTILRPEDMLRLANYRFAVRMMAEGWLSGRHRAKGRGSSTDFLEYRAYEQGDDPRLVDWRVFARTDRLQLKCFENETHLQCHLFVDSSASMAYKERGPISKLEYASHFAACLAWLVIRDKDRVSLQLFDEGIRSFMPPGSTTKHLNQCLNELEHNKAGKKTDLPKALERSRHLLTRPGTLVIISDFLCDTDELMSALNAYLHRGCKIVLIQVLDPAEMELDGLGLARYQDMETGERVMCHLDAIAPAYKEMMLEHRRKLRGLAVSRGMVYLPTLTTESFYSLFDALAR